MLLTLDLGNTNITLGVYDGEDLMFVSRLATNRNRTGDQYAVELLSIFDLYGVSASNIRGSIVCSVVPELTDAMAAAVASITQKRPLVLGPGLKTGLNILTDNPAQVGTDLVAAAVAAAALYPLPCLVVDLGTATKISVIDKHGAFCGCTITAGVAVSLNALAKSTSQLPNISLSAPAKVIGKNTVDSMQSGTVYGTAAMIDGLCERIELELGTTAATIVATGGLSQEIVKCCNKPVEYNGELVLEGLYRIYHNNRKSSLNKNN